jgi:hypothetical protein
LLAYPQRSKASSPLKYLKDILKRVVASSLRAASLTEGCLLRFQQSSPLKYLKDILKRG